MTSSKRKATRETKHQDTLERAQQLPGVREVVDVYLGGKRAELGMDAYRAAMRTTGTTTNRANACDPL